MPITPDDIRDRMADLGINQAELARRSGVHAKALSAILAGRRPIGMDTAQRLARALGCDVQLVERTAAPQNAPHRSAE